MIGGCRQSSGPEEAAAAGAGASVNTAAVATKNDSLASIEMIRDMVNLLDVGDVDRPG